MYEFPTVIGEELGVMMIFVGNMVAVTAFLDVLSHPVVALYVDT